MPQLNDLLDMRGVGQRATSFRFQWLDNDESVIGELHPQRNEGTPTITCDSTRSIVCDMSNFNLIPTEAAAVDTLRHRVKPLMVLEDGSQLPLGVYVWAAASMTRYSYGSPLASALVDKGIALNQPISTTAALDTNRSIRSTIVGVLTGGGVKNKIVDSTDVTVAAPLSWPAGTLRWQILVDLCNLGGYLTPRFDMNGVCVVQLAPDAANLPDPVVVFEEGRNIYAASPVETNDLLTTPSRTTVIGTSASGASIAGNYDVPASAPFSTFNRGYAVTEVVNQQGVASAVEAQAMAKAYALNRTIYEHVTFSCPPDPRVDVYDTIEYLGERWFVQSWSMVLAPEGPMTITARKVYS